MKLVPIWDARASWACTVLLFAITLQSHLDCRLKWSEKCLAMFTSTVFEDSAVKQNSQGAVARLIYSCLAAAQLRTDQEYFFIIWQKTLWELDSSGAYPGGCSGCWSTPIRETSVVVIGWPSMLLNHWPEKLLTLQLIYNLLATSK